MFASSNEKLCNNQTRPEKERTQINKIGNEREQQLAPQKDRGSEEILQTTVHQQLGQPGRRG